MRASPVGADNTVLVADAAQTTGIKWVQVGEAMIALADVTTDDVSSAKHGFAPKSPADATKFLNGAATPAYAQVKDSDLSLSDITTNDVGTSKHGFAPKAPGDATKYLDGTGAYSSPGGGGGSGGGTSLIFRYTVTGADKASIDTGVDTPDAGSNDWTGGDLLEVWIMARTDDAGATSAISIVFNNDNGANYDREVLNATNATVAGSSSLAQTGLAINSHGSGGSASYPSHVAVTIPGYANTTFFKKGEWREGVNDATAANNIVTIRSFGYRSTSAITRLALSAAAGQKLKVGSMLLIYKRLSS
jgi:hypothetical protein